MRVNAAPWRWNACCIKTAGTLNLLRNMVEEQDKVLYICLSSFWDLTLKRSCWSLRDRSSLGQWCNSFPPFDNPIGSSSRATLRSAHSRSLTKAMPNVSALQSLGTWRGVLLLAVGAPAQLRHGIADL